MNSVCVNVVNQLEFGRWLQRTCIIQRLLIILDVDQLTGSIKKTRYVSGSNICWWPSVDDIKA